MGSFTFQLRQTSLFAPVEYRIAAVLIRKQLCRNDWGKSILPS